jgi:hypothetical protein
MVTSLSLPDIEEYGGDNGDSERVYDALPSFAHKIPAQGADEDYEKFNEGNPKC